MILYVQLTIIVSGRPLWAGPLTMLLCGNAYPLMQELRREICSVRPDDRVEFRMEADTAKSGKVSERFEDRAIKLPAQIDFTSQAITEAEPHYVVANVSGVDEANQSLHLDYSAAVVSILMG